MALLQSGTIWSSSNTLSLKKSESLSIVRVVPLSPTRVRRDRAASTLWRRARTASSYSPGWEWGEVSVETPPRRVTSRRGMVTIGEHSQLFASPRFSEIRSPICRSRERYVHNVNVPQVRGTFTLYHIVFVCHESCGVSVELNL